MNIYLVNYWKPFPDSEYGGLQCVIAVNDEQCIELIVEDADLSDYHKREIPDWQERIRRAVMEAQVFALANVEDYKPKIVEEFTT